MMIDGERLIKELEKTNKRMEHIEEDNEILKEKLRQMNNECDMLKAYYDELSASLSEATYLSQENKHLLDKLVSTVKKMADLKKGNIELRKKI